MSLAALVLLAAASGCAAAAPALSLTINPDGSYALASPSWPALSLVSAPVGLLSNGAWLSAGDGSLALLGAPATFAGADAWGAYDGTTLTWAAAAAPAAPLMTTTFKAYAAAPAVAFEAAFPAGVTTGSAGTSASGNVSVAFPSWALPQTSDLGFLQWAGPFVNQGLLGPRTGAFTAAAAAARAFAGGLESGPLALLDAAGGNTLVLSAASDFAAVSAAVRGSALAFGPLGSAAELPAGYSYAAVAWAGAGFNAAMMAWGAAMMSRFNKPHGLAQTDFTATHLIYNTDHGAYYYYTTKPYANYSGVLDAVADYAASAGIPYRGVLLDSWWYFKGLGGGVKNWTARGDVFDGGNAGIRALVDKTHWKIIAHNRYWSADTDYATQNGGQWAFDIDPAKKTLAVPLQQAFWEWLLTDATDWGLTTYEQDWLYNELEGVSPLLTNITLANAWLRELGAGAESAGVSVQLCMAYPRHALMSLEMPTATQIRASDDHVPGWGPKVQWNMAFSSVLAWALGLAPFKDNYESTALQPGGSFGNATEITPSLHNAASVLSAGPVSPGDGVGLSDVAQIMRACDAAGRLLQPSRPATAIDARAARAVFGAAAAGPDGEVSATYTLLPGGWFWDHVLVADLAADYALGPAALAGTRADAALRAGWRGAAAAPVGAVVWSLNATTLDAATLTVAPFSDAAPVTLRACGLADFALVHTAPVWASGWALLGELAKYVPVSAARFNNVQLTAAGASVDVSGAAGEVVRVTFWDAGAGRATTVACAFTDAGTATAAVPAGTCA